MYERITGEDPYKVPMRMYPAPHYTMGGLWVDYNLMSNLPGLFVLGEANFSDHGANRLGASALMQGLADGYFIIPYTIGDFLARNVPDGLQTDHAEFKKAETDANQNLNRFMTINGKRTVDSFHKELGRIMWDTCGMSRTRDGLLATLDRIPAIRDEFWNNLKLTGASEGLNQSLEKAGRVADFLEFAELMCLDALERNESCGGHFREEFQTPEGEALRNDDDYCHVAAWEYNPSGKPALHKEALAFENVKLTQRSYK
jgi:succinate dehydrogenase / fumarate reductase, flavoprotein subunit